MEEVFVFADDYTVVFIGIFPDRKVRRTSQADVKHMLAITASSIYETAKGKRQLVVNEEFHEVCSTV